MKMRKKQVFTLGLLLSVAFSSKGPSMDWLQKEVSSNLGVQIRQEDVQAIIERPTLFEGVKTAVTDHKILPEDFFNEYKKDSTKSASQIINQLGGGGLLVRLGIGAPNADQTVAAKRLGTLGLANTATQDQLDGTEAFIAGGHAAPTLLEVNGWVANVGERATRVLIGAAGLDSTDANLIAATARAVFLGIAAPTDHQINGADHVIRTLAVGGATTANQINAAAAFIAGGKAAPTLLEVNGWVGDAPTRAERVLVAAVGLDGADANLIAATTRAVAAGIAAPTADQINGADHVVRTLAVGGATTANQINGAAAFIAGGKAAPTLLEVNGWVGDAPTRAERVLVGAAGLDATDAGLIAAATRCVAVGIANPTDHQLNGTNAFITAGVMDASVTEINKWVAINNPIGKASLVNRVAGIGVAQKRYP